MLPAGRRPAGLAVAVSPQVVREGDMLASADGRPRVAQRGIEELP